MMFINYLIKSLLSCILVQIVMRIDFSRYCTCMNEKLIFIFLVDSVPLLQVDSSKMDLDIRESRSVASLGVCCVI